MKKFATAVGLFMGVMFCVLSVAALMPEKAAACSAGDTGCGEITCNTYKRYLNSRSLYRFTTYPNVGSHVIATPSPTSTTTDISGWAAFGGGFDYQSGEVVTNRDYEDSQGSFSSTYGFYSMDFPAASNQDRQMYVEEWHHDEASSTWTYSIVQDVLPGCFKAACSLSVVGAGPAGNVVEAGKPFTVKARFTNTGRSSLGSSINGHPLALTGLTASYFSSAAKMVDVNNPYDIGSTFPTAGETYEFTFPVNAPSSLGVYPLKAYPDYYGWFSLGTECEVPGGVIVANAHRIDPIISINSDSEENPTTIDYTAGGRKHDSATMDITAVNRAWLTRQSGGGPELLIEGDHRWDHTYGPELKNTFSYSLPPGGFKPGDKFCAHIEINPGVVYVGDGGVVLAQDIVSVPNCFNINNKPYFHVVGGDISAGGGFGQNCTTLKGGIDAYVSKTGMLPIGSGSQLGARSIKPISGFSSANLRAGPGKPLGSIGLSFANNTAVTSIPPDPKLGGNLDEDVNCTVDYGAGLPSTVANENLPPVPLTLPGSNPSGAFTQLTKQYTPDGGTLVLDAAQIDDGLQLAVFVHGNVVIKNNITYANTAWATKESIPSLRIIALEGNIYIDPGVSQLDGLYVAQPDDGGAKGSIYSCADDTTPIPEEQAAENCDNQLVVNGAFVSQRLFLSRTFGSLRDSSPAETLTPADKLCSTTVHGRIATDKGDCAAEIFRFTPELYLAKPDLTRKNGPVSGVYDSITFLAPVL